MKTGKWIILILLVLAFLAGCFCFGPLALLEVDLRTERFDAAQRIYLSRAFSIEPLKREANVRVHAYVDRLMKRYDARQLPYDTIKDLLLSLTETHLPQDAILERLESVEEMEAARTRLAQADVYYASGEYARAIPLFRQSLIADDFAAFRLEQAETAYKNQILAQTEAAIQEGRYALAETTLREAEDVLGKNEDFSAALQDVRRMEEDQAFDALVEEAHRLMASDGPEAAFSLVNDLRRQQPDYYRLEYLEQQLYHEFEEDICSKASSLWDAGDAMGACSLLEDSLLLIDSDRFRSLHAEIRAKTPILLGEMPVVSDGTDEAGGRVIARDRFMTDVGGNEYEHSFFAESGTVRFELDGSFSLFTGTVAFPLGERSDLYRSSATLEVYGDGKLLAEFKDFDSASSPVPFSIPVEGVQELRLCWTCKGANGQKDWGHFATIFDGKLITSADPDEDQ